MSDQTIRLVAAGVLLVHGLGHGGALIALAWIRLHPGADTGAWLAARSWLLPSLSGEVATRIAGTFWIVSMVGFVIAAMSFWGVAVPDGAWRPVAVASAVVSGVGIVLFIGNWPVFNTVAALGVNAAVLVAVLWLHWPPLATFGR
jgi:hypothetical protein